MNEWMNVLRCNTAHVGLLYIGQIVQYMEHHFITWNGTENAPTGCYYSLYDTRLYRTFICTNWNTKGNKYFLYFHLSPCFFSGPQIQCAAVIAAVWVMMTPAHVETPGGLFLWGLCRYVVGVGVYSPVGLGGGGGVLRVIFFYFELKP